MLLPSYVRLMKVEFADNSVFGNYKVVSWNFSYPLFPLLFIGRETKNSLVSSLLASLVIVRSATRYTAFLYHIEKDTQTIDCSSLCNAQIKEVMKYTGREQ